MPEYIIKNNKGVDKRYSFPTIDDAYDYLSTAAEAGLEVSQVYFDYENNERKIPVTNIYKDDDGAIHTQMGEDFQGLNSDRNPFYGTGYQSEDIAGAYREMYNKGSEPTFEMTKDNRARIIDQQPPYVAVDTDYDPTDVQRTLRRAHSSAQHTGESLTRSASPEAIAQQLGERLSSRAGTEYDPAERAIWSMDDEEQRDYFNLRENYGIEAAEAARGAFDKEYGAVLRNIRDNYGLSPQQYAEQQTELINERIDDALAVAGKLRKSAFDNPDNWYYDADGRRKNNKTDEIDATIRAIKSLRRDLNDSRMKYGDKDGWSVVKRFWAGGDLIPKMLPVVNMTRSLERAGITVGQAVAAGKMIDDPTSLTSEQQLLHSLTALQQSVGQLQQDLGGKHWASSVGEVLSEMPEFMIGMPLAKGATKAISKGASRALNSIAARSVQKIDDIATRALNKVSGWSGVGGGIMRGIGAWGKSFAESAIGAPTQTLFYKMMADEALGQYVVRPDGSTTQIITPRWQQLYKAWLNTALELHSEDMGMWIGKGLNALGRRMANIGFARGLMRIPAARSPFLETLRKEFKVAGPLSEAAGEVYGDAIEPLFTGELDWSETLADEDYWKTTVIASAGVSVALDLPTIPQLYRDGERIREFGVRMDAALENIANDELRSQLVAAASRNSVDAQAKAFANIDWANASREDMAAAMDYVSFHSRRELYYNAWQEMERQEQLVGAFNNTLATVYRGADGFGSSMDIIIATPKNGSTLPAGNKYFILGGDYTNPEGFVSVRREDNGKFVSDFIPVSQLDIAAPIDAASQLAEQYENLFSNQIAEEQVTTLSQRIDQMRAEGVGEEEIREIVSESPAYHEYKEGDVVTDSQTGEAVTIEENIATGEYVARKESGERIAISYDQIADSAAYAQQAEQAERISGSVDEGDIVSFLDRDNNIIEGEVRQVYENGQLYIAVPTVNANGEAVYVSQVISPNQVLPADTLPSQPTPTEQAVQEVQQDITTITGPAPAMAEPTIPTNAAPDPRTIPTLEDGSIDYDAIDDPQQFIDLYGKNITSEELVADVASFRDDAQWNVKRLRNEVTNAKTPNERKLLRDQINIESNRAVKYQAVLDLLTPATPIAEQTEAVPTAPEVAPVAVEVVEPTTEEQATEQPKAGKSKQKADNGVKEWYQNLRLSGEFDHNNSPFVLNPESSIDFGQIQSYHNLPPAPIRLAMGDVENGYIHINRRHGKEIQKAGFTSIEEFVQYVANNITRIQEGESYPNEMGGSNDTYLVQAQDGHNNTLFLQLSRDGEYWNVNSAGVFKKSYGNSKKNIWSASEVQSGNSAVAIDGSQSKPNADEGSTSNGTPSNISESKDTTTEPITQEVEQEKLQPTPENVAEENMVPRKISLEQYLGELGLSQPMSDYMLDKQKAPNLKTEKARKKLEQEAVVSMQEYNQRRESARAEYFNLVENGKIIPLSDIDRLLVAARGHEDLESTQAARRSLEKRGIDWLTGDIIKTIESSQLENEVVEPTSRGIVDMDTLQLTMSDEEFNSLLEGGDVERMNGYLKELDNTLVINDQSPFKGQQELREEFKHLKEQYGGEDNIPTDVMEDINARYKPYAELSRKVYDRKYILEDRLRLAEAQATQTAKKEEVEVKETHQATAFNGFLANKTKLGASSAEKALNKRVKIEDKNYTIAEYVEQAVQSGKIELRTSEVPKYKGVSRRKWNHMDAAQQQAEQERIKNGGTVTEYYINDYNLGKTAYDYAQYLQAKATEQAPETASESQTQSAVEPEWLQKVPTDGRNFMVYTKVAGENNYSATDLKTGQAVGLVYASLVKRDRLQSLVEELPKVLLEGAHFQIRDTNGKIYYSSEPIAPTKGKKKATTKLTTLKTVSGAEVKVPINLYKYVSTDKTRAYTGVYFDPEGFVVATDGHNMIAVKHDVAEADAEKFISKAGDVASTIFNWRIANPKPNTEKPMNVDFVDVEKQIGGKAGDKFVVFEIDGQEVGFPPKAIHVLADFQRAFGGQAFVGDMTAGKAIVIRSGDNYAIALQTTKYADLSQAIHIPSGIEQTTEQVEQPATVSKQAQQPTESTKQEPKPKRTADRKIEDYGEKIAGARKDILRNMSKNFDNATIESLVALPFAKAFVKPDLKKLVEAGVLRPDDAKYAEAIMWVYINKNKPKARKTDVWAAKRGRETRITAWAKKTFDGITRLRDFIEADEATRDELIAQYGQLGEQIKANEDIDRVRLNRLNGGALVFGDLYSPNPIEVIVAALDKLNYQAGDKITFDAPIVKAEYLGRYFNFENQDGEKVYAFSRANSIEEAIDTLVLQAKIRRGDTDIQYPTDMFSITREDPIREPSGMFTVFHINKRGSLVPETVEGREAAEKKVADYQSQGLSADLREEKKIVGYATHRIRFKNRLTDVETIFDEKFGSEGEARQALEERYDEFNDLANDYVASLSKQKREQPVPFEVTTSWNSETKVVKYVVKNTETGDVMSPQLDTRKEAEEYYKNHIEEWKAKWQEMKDARKKFVFFDDNVKPREGKDYRNGRDVTAEDLATTFGFRGIQFGNWTNDADRQAALNQAYDAFMDLADILGVSPKALSLAGELGIAFGARGGGSALAHYEPDEIVINLTKTKGAGSLAHEWWHALDNYFSRQGNIPMGFVTSNPAEAKMRVEMRVAWQGVVKAVKGTEYAKRSMAQGDYWGRMLEMTARLFGEWTVYELAKTGRTNHFLSRGITPGRFDRWRRMNYAAYKWSLPEDQTPMPFEEFALLPRSLKGMPFPTKEETEQMGEAVRNLFDVVQEKVDEQGNVVLFQRGDFPEMPNTEANRRAYNLVREKLQNAGIKVHEVSEEMANAMASLIGVEFATKRKSATETVLPEDESSFKGTAISTADGAKILKNLDNLANKYQELSNRPWTFIGDVANALGISMPNKASKYGIFEAMNGNEITIRLSDHNATVSNLDGVGENNAISIVISRKPNNGITNDGNAHIVEYYYPASKIQKADGKPLVDIITSIKQALYSGEFIDTTGLAEREEVNLNDAEYQIVYHGSGAKFDRFDHSFMGSGEGAQAYGWGTYVTQVEGIGRSYSKSTSKGEVLINGKPISKVLEDQEIWDPVWANWINRYARDAAEMSSYILSAYIDGRVASPRSVRVRQFQQQKQRLLEMLDNGDFTFPPSYLYSVDILDSNGEYLQWDKNVSKYVRKKLIESVTEGNFGFWVPDHLREASREARAEYWLKEAYPDNPHSGEAVYNLLSVVMGSDRAASAYLRDNGFIGIEYPAQYQSGGRADNAKNYVIFNENDLKIVDRIELFQDAEGKIYGWAVGGEIYLTPDGLNANTAIHEYSHLWVEALRKKDSKKWAEIKSQLKATPFWQQVIDDPNYERIRENEDAVASEVLARLTGKNGAERLAAEAQRIIDAGNGSLSARIESTALVQRVKRLLRDLWAWVARNIFGVTNEATISQLSDMVVDDLLDETLLTDTESSPFEAMFIGELGANTLDIEQRSYARMNNLDVATQMEEAGKSPFDIKIATGWERGADGEWRYEISDAKAHLNLEGMSELNRILETNFREGFAAKLRQFEARYPNLAERRQQLIEAETNSRRVEAMDKIFGLTPIVAEFKLRDLFDYEDAYEAYPELKNYDVRIIDRESLNGSYYKGKFDIALGVSRIPARMRAVLLHEIQHAIQEKEGFAAGGNPEMFMDFDRIEYLERRRDELNQRINEGEEGLEDDLREVESELVDKREEEPYYNYRRLAGEVEARNVMKRRDMTAAQRRTSLATSTEDFSRDEQLVRARQSDDSESLSEETKYSSRVESLSAVAHDVAAKLNAPIQIITDMNDVPRARQSWKGWWQRGESGEQIVVVVPNNIDAADIERTVLHEAVAHYGLRKLLGESKFNLLLDTILKSMSEEEVQQRLQKYGTNDPMVVADEYIAEVAEGNATPSMFERVVSAVRTFLRDVLGLNVQMTDNDIRYLLWQSKNALEGKSAFGRAMVMAQGKPLAGIVAEEYGYARAYTAEEQQIIAEEQRNGTYLKAPNGKPTNLTPKQWVQVRTDAFKRWFGDWENDPANASKVIDENGEPMVVEHSTWNEDFYTFDIERLGESSGDEGLYGAGFYFGNVGHTQLYGDRAIRVYLDAKNPLVLPEDNIMKSFDYLVENFDKEGLRDIVVKNGKKSATLGKIIGVIKEVQAANANGEYDELIEQMKQYWSGAEDRVIEQTIFRKVGFAFYRALTPFIDENIGRREFSKSLQAAGYDGVIFNNREYVVYNPAQIKSAEINSGEFDPTDPDIRARRTSTQYVDEQGTPVDATPIQKMRAVSPTLPFRARTWLGKGWESIRRKIQDSQSVAAKTINGVIREVGERELARRKRKGSAMISKRELAKLPARLRKVFDGGSAEDVIARYKKRSASDQLVIAMAISGFNATVDYLSAENRSESQGEYAMAQYIKNYIDPMNESRLRMRELMGVNDDQVEAYVSAESSLERHNSGIDALSTKGDDGWTLKTVEGIVISFRQRLRNNIELKIKSEGVNALTEAEREVLGEDIVRQLTEGGWDSLGAAEQMAVCEAPVEVLWERIRKVNDEHLNILLRAGRYTHEDIERIKSHNWKYYVPLFGINYEAEGYINPFDVYDFDVYRGTANAPSLSRATGRNTRSQNVFRSMYQLGQRCIAFEARNRVAQTLYDFTHWAADRLGVPQVASYWQNGITYQTKTASGKWQDEERMLTRDEMEQVRDLEREINSLRRERLDVSRQIDRLSHDVLNTMGEQAADVLDDALRGLVSRRDELLNKIVELEGSRKWRAKRSHFSNETVGDQKKAEAERKVRVWVNGREHSVIFNDPAIARAVNMGYGTNKFWQFVGAVTRFRAQLNTQFSPDFIVSNTIRDFQHALLAMALAEQDGVMLSFAKNYFGRLGDVYRSRGASFAPLTEADMEGRVPYFSEERMRAAYIASQLRGEKLSEEEFEQQYRRKVATDREALIEKFGAKRVMDTLMDAFNAYGGATGFIHALNAKQIEKQFREAMMLKEDSWLRRYVDPTKPFVAVRDAISRISETMEDNTRFATFLSHLDNGASVEQAAQQAKEVTTNFNRRGEWSSQVGSLYMFFNASMQGSSQIMRLIKHHPTRAAWLLPSYAALGFVSRITKGLSWKIILGTILKTANWDWDDDDKPRTLEQMSGEKDIRDYMYRDNLIITLYRTLDAAEQTIDGMYLRLPQPNGFRAAFKIGVELAESVMGEQEWRELPWAITADIAGEFLYGYDDTGDLTSDFFKIFWPTPVQPFTDLAANRDFVGRQIYPDRSYNPIKPSYQMAKRNTAAPYVWASMALNSLLGSDTRSADYNKQFEERVVGLDVPPEALQYLVGEIFGGVGTFANRAYVTAQLLTGGELPSMRDVPLLNRALGEYEEVNAYEDYYNFTQSIENAWRSTEQFRKDNGIDMRQKEWKNPNDTYPKMIEHYQNTGNPEVVEYLRKRWLLGQEFKREEKIKEELKRINGPYGAPDRKAEQSPISKDIEALQTERTIQQKFILEVSKHVDWRAQTNEEVLEQLQQVSHQIITPTQDNQQNE